ncbi:CARDB domain-containing protein, partial [Halorientalis pallida]
LAAGTYTHGVSTANDTATAQITLDTQPDPTNFQVSSIESNSPVTEGETLTIDATVENTGDQQGTQTVTLSVLGTADDQQVTLAGGASQTVTLSVATQTGDAGQYAASVTTANDTVSTTVRVKAPNAPADFQLSGVSSDSPVTEGDTLDVTATVQNVGDQQGTQTVALSVNGTERDSQSVQLAGGASQTISLSWATGSGDAGNYTATVTSANDTGTTSVEVQSSAPEPATISGSVAASGNGTAIAGATVSAGSQSTTSAADGSYTLSVGGGSTYTVTADAEGYQSSSQTVSPAAGETVTVDFDLAAESGDGGDGKYNLTGPTDFTGYVLGDDAYLHTGTPDNSRPITYSRCRDGQPAPSEQKPFFLPTDECITFEGTVFPSNNSWVGDVNFEPVTGIINDTKTQTLGNVYYEADFSTVGGARGTFDPTTGETSLDTTVSINVSIWPVGSSIFSTFSPAKNPYSQRTNEVTDPTCTIPNVQIEASSEKSFTSGSPFPGVGTTVSGERLNESLYGKVVTDDFSVGSAMDCNDNYFGVNMNNQVDLEQGLPAPAGDNEAVYDIKLNLQD